VRLLWLFAAIVAAALAWWDWQDSVPDPPAALETPGDGSSGNVVDVEVVEE